MRNKRKNDRFDLGEPKSGPGAYPKPRPLQGLKTKRTNTVMSGPGSQRKGKKYIVKYDRDRESVVHVYGRGKKAKRVYVNDDTAHAYGVPNKKYPTV